MDRHEEGDSREPKGPPLEELLVQLVGFLEGLGGDEDGEDANQSDGLKDQAGYIVGIAEAKETWQFGGGSPRCVLYTGGSASPSAAASPAPPRGHSRGL